MWRKCELHILSSAYHRASRYWPVTETLLPAGWDGLPNGSCDHGESVRKRWETAPKINKTVSDPEEKQNCFS